MAIAQKKINELSIQIAQIRNLQLSDNTLDRSQVFDLVNKVKNQIKNGEDLDIGLALLGSLYAMMGELASMQFNYEKAVKINPNNHAIRYNYGIDLLHAHKPKLALLQLNKASELTNDTKDLVKMLVPIFNLMRVNDCKKILSRVEGKTMSKEIKNIHQFLGAKRTIRAYNELPLDIPNLQKLIDGIYTDVYPFFPQNIFVEQYYDEDDKTLNYSFIDTTSDIDKVIDFDDRLTNYIIDFESKNNIHFNNVVFMYEAKQ